MDDLENLKDRVAQLEAVVADMESRRRRLIPKALDDNPNVQLVLADGVAAFTEKLKMFAEQKNIDEATTRFNNARVAALETFEKQKKAGEQAELAEIAAAIEYYQRYGVSPPGYNIVE